MQETEKVESYEILKKKFLDKIGRFDAFDIKESFRCIVESERTASTIMSVKDLIRILEDRDLLNEDKLDALCKILKYYQTTDLLNDADELQEDIHLHEKEFDCPSNRVCQICFKETCDAIELKLISPTAPPQSPDFNIPQFQPVIPEIDAIIKYISENVGKEWRRLASLLPIQERKIKNIHNEYGEHNIVKAAYEALSEWRSNHHHISDDEKKERLIECLQRRRIYNLCPVADGIKNGTHLLQYC